MAAMGENVQCVVVRRSKEEKKLLRKHIKTSHILLKHEGISTQSQPTKVKTYTFNNRMLNKAGEKRE